MFYIQNNNRLKSATDFALLKHLFLCLSMTILQVSVQLLCLLAENIYLKVESLMLEYTLFEMFMVRVKLNYIFAIFYTYQACKRNNLLCQCRYHDHSNIIGGNLIASFSQKL